MSQGYGHPVGACQGIVETTVGYGFSVLWFLNPLESLTQTNLLSSVLSPNQCCTHQNRVLLFTRG